MKAVAFVGTHSSGKTSLISAYCHEHPTARVHKISGITRAVIARGFPLEKNSTVDSFTNYVRDQLQAERISSLNAPDLLFSDRTVLDAASYAKVNSQLPRPSVPQYFVEMLLEIALVEASRFSLFVYCPAEFPMAPDPVRPLDESYRQEVSRQVRRFLDEYSVPYVAAEGDVLRRLSILTRAIEALRG